MEPRRCISIADRVPPSRGNAALDRSFWRFWGRELCYAPPESDRAHHAQWMIVATAQALGMPRDRPLPFTREHRLVILTGPISGEVRVLVRRRGGDRPFCPYWGLSHYALSEEKYGYAPLRWGKPWEKSKILQIARRHLRQLRPCIRDLMEEDPRLWDEFIQK